MESKCDNAKNILSVIQRMRKLPDNIRDILICGVCYEVQYTGIITMTTCCSKSLCVICHHKIQNKTCPFCKTKEYRVCRNRMIEELLNIIDNTTLIPHSTISDDMPKTTLTDTIIIPKSEIALLYHTSFTILQLQHEGLARYYGYHISNPDKLPIYIKGQYNPEKMCIVDVHYELINNSLDFRNTVLSVPEIVQIGISICDTLLYLYSKDVYDVGSFERRLQISKDLSTKFIPRAGKTSIQKTEINGWETLNVQKLKSLLLDIFKCSSASKLTAKTISEFRYNLFELLDTTELTLCERLYRDGGGNHNVYDFESRSYKYQQPIFTISCEQCGSWFTGLMYQDNCPKCLRWEPRYPFIIKNFGHVLFREHGKISELVNFMSEILMCKYESIILYDESRRRIDDNLTIYTYLRNFKFMTLKVNYRLA
jgi:hypothetical protein